MIDTAPQGIKERVKKFNLPLRQDDTGLLLQQGVELLLCELLQAQVVIVL